jgi:NlpC/P60 family
MAAVPVPALVGTARIAGPVVAAAAARYEGAGYVYGGTASRVGDWDCSSFVSYVLGHDLSLQLPGGRWGAPGFPPAAHGPVVLSYAAWAGATTVTTVQAGDLCVWPGAGPNGHIGVAVSGTQMVSALNPQQGTVRTPIGGYGPPGVPLIYRRLNGVAAGAPAPAGALTSAPPAGLKVGIGVLVALLLPALTAAGLAITGTVLAVAAAYVVRQAAWA